VQQKHYERPGADIVQKIIYTAGRANFARAGVAGRRVLGAG
jgi:hypothetical protein